MVGIDIGQDFRLEATAKSNERSGSEKNALFFFKIIFPDGIVGHDYSMATPDSSVLHCHYVDGSPLLPD